MSPVVPRAGAFAGAFLARGNEGGRGGDEDREGARAEPGRGGDASLKILAVGGLSRDRGHRVVKCFLRSCVLAPALLEARKIFLVVRADFSQVVWIGAGGSGQLIGALGYGGALLRTTGAICQGCTR